MKKLVAILMLCLITAALYAIPPTPGTKHEGCLHHSMNIAPFRSPSKQAADSSLQKISPLSPAPIENRNLLVILVNFTDKKFDPSRADPDFYETMLGKEGEPAGSMTMRKYYQDMSGGKLNLTFTVLGPYDLDNNMAYYGANIDGIAGNDIRRGDLVTDAIKKAEESGDLDSPWAVYADNWDFDNDGNIDNVFIVHAWEHEKEISNSEILNPDSLLSSWWSLKDAKKNGMSTYDKYEININGIKKIFNYHVIVSEYTALGYVPGPSIGIFCHEYGHVLGLGDLYDYTYETNGVDYWSLMGYGDRGTMGYKNTTTGSDPVTLLAWEKYYLGWLTPETITPTAKPQTFKFSDIEESRKAWKIDLNPSGSQYLILEGKKRNATGIGWAVPEDGLLITHIDEDILSKYWVNEINKSKTRVHGIDVVEAQSPYYETTGLGNLWNAESSVTVCFRNTTKTELMPYYGKAVAGAGLLVSLILMHRKRKKLGMMLLICFTICFMACSLGGHSSHSANILGLPNTNYYTSELVTSKTGISGITITVNCPAGSSSGTFTVVKEK